MKKRIALIATAALCALAICLCAIPALPVFAEGEEPTNVALNAQVTTTAGQILDDGGTSWYAAALVDGVKANVAAGGVLLAPGGDFLAPVDSPIDITLDLGGRYTISSVDLYDAYGGGFAMPEAYIISVSDNGVDFTPVATVTDGVQATTQHTVEFDAPATGSYLRLTVTKGCDQEWDVGMSFCAIGELEAWGVPAEPLAGETETETEGETTVVELSNVALNQFVTIDGVANVDYLDNSEWNPGFVVDGINDGGTSGNGVIFMTATPFSESHPATLVISLDAAYEIYALAVFGGYNNATAAFPVDYTLALSMNGTDWETVATVEDGSNTEEAVDFLFAAPKEARFIRLQITQGSGWDLSTFAGLEFLGCDVTTIGEIEAYGVRVGGSTETETETETETVTETVTETETETVTETVTETETVLESEDESESTDESVEESETTDETTDETVGETVVGETTAGTTAGTDAPAADEGCASVVGFGAVAVLTAAAAAVVLKKKD